MDELLRQKLDKLEFLLCHYSVRDNSTIIDGLTNDIKDALKVLIDSDHLKLLSESECLAQRFVRLCDYRESRELK